MYRPATIRLERHAGMWAAWVIERDDGLNEDGTPQLFAGLALERGPYVRLTHRGAWRRAYRAAGRRLWDVPESLTVARDLNIPRDPTMITRY